MATIKFELTFDTENGSFSVVNTETGEVQEVSIPKTTKKTTSTKKTSSKPKDDGDPNPKIVLEENKYTLNTAAADILLNSTDENRLEIKYMKNGKETVPVIMNSNSGNKVTKSNTVACRGKANTDLSEYGSVFTLRPYPGKSGVYILVGDKKPIELTGDDKVSIPEDDVDVPSSSTPVVTEDDDLDLSDILGDDGDETEVSSMSFEL